MRRVRRGVCRDTVSHQALQEEDRLTGWHVWPGCSVKPPVQNDRWLRAQCVCSESSTRPVSRGGQTGHALLPPCRHPGGTWNLP